MASNPIIQQNLTSFGCFNGLAPKKGPRFLTVALDFSAAIEIDIDLVIAQQGDQLEWVQTLFINNRLSAQPFISQNFLSNQVLEVPPNSQAYLPTLCPNQPRFSFKSNGGVICHVSFISVAMPALIWNVLSSAGGGGGGGSVATLRQIVSGSTDTSTSTDGTVAWASESGVAKTQTHYTGTAVSNVITYVDEEGDAGTNNITINATGGQTINELASFVMNINYQSVTMQFDGVSNWVII